MNEVAEVRLTARQRYWLEHVQACEVTGKTIAEYAQAHGLQAKSMYAGKKSLVKKGILPHTQRTRFRRAQLVEAVVISEWQIQLPNGLTVSFTGNVDPDALHTVLKTAATVE